MDDQIYSFLFRGLLTEESLDKAGRQSKTIFTDEEEAAIAQKLSLPFFDDELLGKGKKMALVYTAIFCFENSVRDFVERTLRDNTKSPGEDWWDNHVTDSKIKKRINTRKDEELSYKKWHGNRGNKDINYVNLDDLIKIITAKENWEYFEPNISSQNWAKNIFETLKHSRNIIMHSGELELEDIERVAMCIRDWDRQIGY